MPIYEYECDKRHRFDALQKFSDDPLTSCEVCGAPVRRVLHPVAVHFKGSGFYSTDYGKKKRRGDAGTDGGSKSEGTSSSSEGSKSDSSSSSSSTSSSSDSGSSGSSGSSTKSD